MNIDDELKQAQLVAYSAARSAAYSAARSAEGLSAALLLKEKEKQVELIKEIL